MSINQAHKVTYTAQASQATFLNLPVYMQIKVGQLCRTNHKNFHPYHTSMMAWFTCIVKWLPRKVQLTSISSCRYLFLFYLVSFFVLGFYPRYPITCTYHVSLGSSWLWQVVRLSFFIISTFLRSIGQVFHRIPFYWSLSDFFHD